MAAGAGMAESAGATGWAATVMVPVALAALAVAVLAVAALAAAVRVAPRSSGWTRSRRDRYRT